MGDSIDGINSIHYYSIQLFYIVDALQLFLNIIHIYTHLDCIMGWILHVACLDSLV